MRDWQGQSHVKSYCKYHMVFAPKYRRRREGVVPAPRRGDRRGACDGRSYPICLSIPPKYSVARTIGFLKGKTAIQIHHQFLGQKRDFTGVHFWARGYCVSTIGLDEVKIRAYIRDQEAEEKRLERLRLQGL